jgi:ribonuclease HI
MPPGEGTIKMNVDAAFSPQSKEAAIEEVARDSQGVVIAAICLPIYGCQDVEEAEARAILAGLHLGHELHVDRLVIESDSKLVVSTAKSSTPNYSRNWSIYKDIEDAKCVFPT